jgi:hypothetical protein
MKVFASTGIICQYRLTLPLVLCGLVQKSSRSEKLESSLKQLRSIYKRMAFVKSEILLSAVMQAFSICSKQDGSLRMARSY